MTQCIAASLSLSRKLLLGGAVAVMTAPFLCGQVSAARLNAVSEQPAHALAYDIVSIKPNKTPTLDSGANVLPYGYRFVNSTLLPLVARAFDVRGDRVSGVPGWLRSDRYDIMLKMDDETMAAFQKLPESDEGIERIRMIQAALVDRLKLKVHRETKIATSYALVIAKRGFKLKEADPNNTNENGMQTQAGGPRKGISVQSGKLRAQAITMSRFADQLAAVVQGPVKNQTGLTGRYDITLDWTPDTGGPASEEGGPSILTALQEQLGLKLEATKGPVDVLVIDHIERPTEN